MIKLCEVCNEDFNARRKTVRFCGKECQAKGYSMKMKGKSTKKDYVSDRPLTADCIRCTKTFPTTTKSSNKYCSQECWKEDVTEQKAIRDKQKEQERLHALSNQTCGYCNGTFSNERKVKYCSDQCKDEAYRSYYDENYYARYEALRQKKIDEYIHITYQCKECGEDFTPDYGDTRTTYCSETCSRKHLRRNAKYRRRVRMKEQFVERVSLTKICERDNFTCQLCNEPVDMSLEGTSERLAPSLDHIKPLAKGGEHSYANTQLAHHYCNSVKNDKFEEKFEKIF